MFGLLFVAGVAILVWCVLTCPVVVSQQTVKIIERFGGFETLAEPGLNFKAPWPIDAVAETVDLRIVPVKFDVQVRTKDNTFLEVPVSIHFRVSDPYKAYYELSQPSTQMMAFASNVIRSEGAKLDLSELYESKDNIKIAVIQELKTKIAGYGFEFEDVVVDQPQPSESVKAAFDKVISSKRALEATQNEAEAVRIRVVAEAQANKEAMRLAGEGIASQREAIAEGLQRTMETFRKSGLSPETAIALMVITNGQDAVRDASKNKASVIVGSVDGNSLLSQMQGVIAGMKSANNSAA